MNQLLSNSRTHGPHSPLRCTVSRAQLILNTDMTRHTSHQHNAPVLGAIGNHLLRRMLSREVRARDVDGEQLLLFFVGGVEEGNVSVYAGAGDADVEFVGEVFLEGCKAFCQGFGRGNVDSLFLWLDLSFFLGRSMEEDNRGNIQIVPCLHAVFLLDLEEALCRGNDIEYGYVGACFCESFGEGEATATSSSGNEGCSAFQGELSRLVFLSCNFSLWG